MEKQHTELNPSERTMSESAVAKILDHTNKIIRRLKELTSKESGN
jgi:hypothetical protein